MDPDPQNGFQVIYNCPGHLGMDQSWLGASLGGARSCRLSLGWTENHPSSINRKLGRVESLRVLHWYRAQHPAPYAQKLIKANTGLSCLHGDCLLITTSTLTQHIIISVMTSPTLAPPADSISYAIAARDCLLDGPRSEGRLATESQTDKEMSTLTLGFASLGNDEVYSFASEWV